jgi:hypothetical protein
MTAEQLKSVLPKGRYVDLVPLEQDIRRALRKTFPDAAKIERETPLFELKTEPGKALDAVGIIRPQDAGERFWVRIVGGQIEDVTASGTGPAEWLRG